MSITGAPSADELTEYREGEATLIEHARKVAALIRESKHCVVYTGAGVSTAANIPDYRGPKGVWTLKAEGKRPTMKVSLTEAVPTYTHMALIKLMDLGKLQYVVSTNCDGLHRRSGIPAAAISELHGNIYQETCIECSTEFIRPFDIRQKRTQFIHSKRTTGRLCERVTADGSQCLGKLRENIVNFCEILPEAILNRAIEHSEAADLVIVLGTSMRITPACELPSLSYKNGGAFVLCNLQKTGYDEECEKSGGARVFAECDAFMAKVMEELDEEVPTFAPDIDALAKLEQEIVVDPEFRQGMNKYNVMSMAEDGPPPAGILAAIKEGFSFRTHVPVQERVGLALGKVCT